MKLDKNSKTGKLKIVQVVPNYMTIPPGDYGAIERIAYDLTEQLVNLGHEVYVFARKGSRTSGKLIEYPDNYIYPTEFILENIPNGVDIIHDHTRESLVGTLNLDIPTVSTIHDNFMNTVKYPIFVSSKARELLNQGNGVYVYNGLDTKDYQYNETKENYLLFIGAWMPHKGISLALDVAERANEQIKIAGPIHEWGYFEKEIKWRIDTNYNIKAYGVVGGQIRQELYKNAKCVLFTSVWEEPFGLVMIESMACGTPVLALNKGAVPEVMKGFPELICESIDEMVEKVKINKFPKSEDLRRYVEEEFSLKKMTREYEKIYYEVLNNK